MAGRMSRPVQTNEQRTKTRRKTNYFFTTGLPYVCRLEKGGDDRTGLRMITCKEVNPV